MFTAESGITTSSQDFESYGKVAMLELYISHSSAWTAGNQYQIGSIGSSYRPAVNAGGSLGTSGVAILLANGNVYVRPIASDALSANSSTYVRFTYLLA